MEHQLPQIKQKVMDEIYQQCRSGDLEPIINDLQAEQPCIYAQVEWFRGHVHATRNERDNAPFLFTIALIYGTLRKQAIDNERELPVVSQEVVDKYSIGTQNAFVLGTLNMRARLEQLEVENPKLHHALLLVVSSAKEYAACMAFAIEMTYGLLTTQLATESANN